MAALPSVKSRTLDKRAVTISVPSCYFFFAERWFQLSVKYLLSAQEKTLSKETFGGTVDTVCCLPSVTLNKSFAECFLGFAVCLWHTAKLLFPEVISLSFQWMFQWKS